MRDLIECFYTYCDFNKVLNERADKEALISRFIRLKMDEMNQLSAVCSIVSNLTGISLDSMRTQSRKREVVEARQICMYLIRKYKKNLSLREIGEFFSNARHSYDHATVHYSCLQIENFKETNKKFREGLEFIENEVVKILNDNPQC